MADDRGDDEQGGVSDAQLMEEVVSRTAEVSKLITKRDKAAALELCLKNPPLAAKSKDVKDANADIVERVLLGITDNEFPGMISQLDSDSCDVLMKYIYRLMAKPNNCALLLKFHGHLVERAGLGSVVRAMTDRKTV